MQGLAVLTFSIPAWQRYIHSIRIQIAVSLVGLVLSFSHTENWCFSLIQASHGGVYSIL